MLVPKFINYLKNERNYSPHTVKSYYDDVIQFFHILGLAPDLIENINVENIRFWIVNLKSRQFSTKTINRKISALKTFFNYCRREKYITINPVLKIRTLREPKRLPVVLSESSLDNLFSINGVFKNGFQGNRDRLILELFYQTGIRLAELIGIKLNDYDPCKKELRVLGKRNKERIIPLTQSLVDLLNNYIVLRSKTLNNSETPFLFTTNHGKKSYSKMIYRIVNHYLSLVSSIKKRSPHVLRHAFATHLLNRGADLNAIKDLLGHATLLSTQVYTQVSGEKIKKAYKKSHPRG